MEFKIRKIDKDFFNVEVIVNNVNHDMGLFTHDDCIKLSRILESASDELLEGW